MIRKTIWNKVGVIASDISGVIARARSARSNLDCFVASLLAMTPFRVLAALLIAMALLTQNACAATEFVCTIKQDGTGDYSALPTWDASSRGSGNQGIRIARLIDGHGDAPFGFEFTLDSFIHALSKPAWDPGFAALITHLDRDIFKEIKLSFNQAVQRCSMAMQPAAALRAQSIFHYIFSLRVLGSSHLAGSNQWTVMI